MRKESNIPGEDRLFSRLRKSIMCACKVVLGVIEQDADISGVRVDFSKWETPTDLKRLFPNMAQSGISGERNIEALVWCFHLYQYFLTK